MRSPWGEYLPAEGRISAHANVSPDTPTPLLTSLHEIGHHMENELDSKDVDGVIKAMEDSRKHQFLKGFLSQKDADYHLSRDEIWARAYAQYIAQKSGDHEALTELHSVLSDPSSSWKQWDKSEWTPIEEAITKALQNKKWQ
jgi:hypothetical protein